MAPTLPQDLLGVVSFLLVKEPLTLGYPCLGAQEIPCRIRFAIYFAQKLHLPSLVRRVVASVPFPPPSLGPHPLPVVFHPSAASHLVASVPRRPTPPNLGNLPLLASEANRTSDCGGGDPIRSDPYSSCS